MTTVFTGQARVVEHRAMELLGSIYASLPEVLAEYVDNGVDAGASKVWVVLSPDRIAVVDNGDGMVPAIREEDRELLRMFTEDLQTGKISPDEDVRQWISRPSRCSLQWMMENAAFSPKIPDTRREIRGMRGIGAMAFRQIADQATWRTRPNAELQAEYNAKAKKPIPKNGTFVLTPPTQDQLHRSITDYTIEELTQPVFDPYRRELNSGTHVEIFGLKPEIETLLRPTYIAENLQGRFGEDIRSGRLNLIVVDRITEEGRRRSAGREIIVEPSHYKGFRVFADERPDRQFDVEIYYDPSGRGLAPMLRRKHAEVRSLTDLEEFKKPPWNSGKLSGFVDFPDVPENQAPWSTDKKLPLPSPVRNHWQKAVWRAVGSINAGIAKVETQIRERRVKTLGDDVGRAALEAVRRSPTFQDLFLGVPTPPGPPRPRPPHPPRPIQAPTTVTAKVFDEHNRGMAGVPIQLADASSNKVIHERLTGEAGGVTFGEVEGGRYLLRIITPKGMTLEPPEEYRFRLTTEQPGFRAVFHLMTFTPPPEKRRLPQLQVVHNALSDPDVPYVQHLEFGLVEVNTEAPDFRQAVEGEDEDAQLTLTALYTAMAVTEYGLKETTARVFPQASHLFAAIYEISRDLRQERRRSEAARRSKHS